MWRPLRNSSFCMDFAKHNFVQMMFFSLYRNQAEKKHGGDRLFVSKYHQISLYVAFIFHKTKSFFDKNGY